MKCKTCPAMMPDDRRQKHCVACIDKASLRSMKAYERRRAAGLCRRCGNVLEDDRKERSVCAGCNAENTAYERKKRPIRVDQRRRRRQRKRARMALLRMRGRAS